MNRESLKALILKHEGLRNKVYKDSLGFNTIGVGRCLDTQGITDQEALYLLDNDITKVVVYCREALPWFNSLDDIRQNVVASMIFNLGAAGFAEFKKTIAAIIRKDYEGAASGMLNSKWASQVGPRAVELASMMLTVASP